MMLAEIELRLPAPDDGARCCRWRAAPIV